MYKRACNSYGLEWTKTKTIGDVKLEKLWAWFIRILLCKFNQLWFARLFYSIPLKSNGGLIGLQRECIAKIPFSPSCDSILNKALGVTQVQKTIGRIPILVFTMYGAEFTVCEFMDIEIFILSSEFDLKLMLYF